MAQHLAVKIYKTESVSVAHIAPATVATMDNWRRATGLRLNPMLSLSEADSLNILAKLRAGTFTVTAEKRRGYFQLTAWDLA